MSMPLILTVTVHEGSFTVETGEGKPYVCVAGQAFIAKPDAGPGVRIGMAVPDAEPNMEEVR